MSALPASSTIPKPGGVASRLAARALVREGHVLAGLEAMHAALGDVFQLPLPGFRSVVVVGPEANRWLLTEVREHVLWRSEGDPVTRLLRQGLLVVDGTFHDELRQIMTPALHRSLFDGFAQVMWQATDRVISHWPEGARIDMFGAARRIALLIVTAALFGEDIDPELDALWGDILRTIRYISPGPWLLWSGLPRPGYQRALRRMDAYLARLIARRRAQHAGGENLVGRLIASGMSDALIRDQLLTMLIAGHDTSTALLTWSLYLLASHPGVLERARAEIDEVLGARAPVEADMRQMPYLECVIKEALRLYPPIHLGSRVAATDLDVAGYRIMAGTRVLYSIYLTHRDERFWRSPDVFDPGRFAPERARERVAYTFLPFGGGPRNCIGAAFAQVEAKIVLARILQRCDIRFVGGRVRPRMRATLEPRPACSSRCDTGVQGQSPAPRSPRATRTDPGTTHSLPRALNTACPSRRPARRWRGGRGRHAQRHHAPRRQRRGEVSSTGRPRRRTIIPRRSSSQPIVRQSSALALPSARLKKGSTKRQAYPQAKSGASHEGRQDLLTRADGVGAGGVDACWARAPRRFFEKPCHTSAAEWYMRQDSRAVPSTRATPQPRSRKRRARAKSSTKAPRMPAWPPTA